MKNPLSLRLLYLISEFVLWIIIALIILFLYLTGMALLNQPLNIKLDYGVHIEYITEVSYFGELNNIPVELEFEEGTIKIPMKDLNQKTLIYSFLGLNLIFGCLLFIAFFFRKFMKQVIKGNTFDFSSILLIKKMAWSLVLLEIVLFAYNTIVYTFISKNVITAFKLSQKISFPSTALIVALCLWALAHIFTKGRELEEEQKLTV